MSNADHAVLVPGDGLLTMRRIIDRYSGATIQAIGFLDNCVANVAENEVPDGSNCSRWTAEYHKSVSSDLIDIIWASIVVFHHRGSIDVPRRTPCREGSRPITQKFFKADILSIHVFVMKRP